MSTSPTPPRDAIPYEQATAAPKKKKTVDDILNGLTIKRNTGSRPASVRQHQRQVFSSSLGSSVKAIFVPEEKDEAYLFDDVKDYSPWSMTRPVCCSRPSGPRLRPTPRRNEKPTPKRSTARRGLIPILALRTPLPGISQPVAQASFADVQWKVCSRAAHHRFRAPLRRSGRFSLHLSIDSQSLPVRYPQNPLPRRRAFRF